MGRDWDVIIFSEMWVEEKKWKRIKERLPGEYTWGVQFARKSIKGTASGGMLMGIRRGIEEGKGINTEVEEMMEGRIRIGTERWRVVGVYVGKGMEKTLKDIAHWVENKEIGAKTLIGGIVMQEREGKRSGSRIGDGR